MSEEVQGRIEKMIKNSEAILNAGKEKLRNCPFCGGEATANESSWRGWWHGWVICKNCGATIDKPTKEETIEAWNKRVVDANKTITCFKCHGLGEYPVPIDPDYSWDECEQHKCEVCGGTGKITLEWYEKLQQGMRDKE